MLSLAAEREEIRVVHDQIGSPTYTPDLAAHVVKLAEIEADGVFHVANCGQASWCELASEAVKLAGLHCKVQPITTAEYPTRAERPRFSVLSNAKFKAATGITPRPWAQALRDYVFQEIPPE
jgi:dTDP-4-dehydrorhamnose reductase